MRRTIETIRSDVEGLNPDEVREVKVEIGLAVHNAELGIDALLQHEDVLRVIYRKYVSPVLMLRTLIAALLEAKQDVDDARPTRSGARELGWLVFADREKLLAQLTSWSVVGLVSRREVESIRENRGPVDAARGVLAMIALLDRSLDMKKRSLVSDDALGEMKTRAQKLLTLAQPRGRRRRTNPELTRAIDTQARVWTLLVRQYDLLWQEAVRIFGRKVDDHVPPLGSRVLSKRKAEEAAGPVSG